MELSRFYSQRQTAEYRQAFDLAAATCQQADGVLAVVSSTAWAVELTRRISAPLYIYAAGDFQAGDFVHAAREWAAGPLAADNCGVNQPYPAVIWAEPERGSSASVVQRLTACSSPGTSLVIINTTPLGGLLPAGQRRDRPAQQPLPPPAAGRLLQRHGWRIEQRLSLHGPRSIACSLLARAAALAGRPDWHDRCLFAQRSVYREPGWLWPLATVSMTFLCKVA